MHVTLPASEINVKTSVGHTFAKTVAHTPLIETTACHASGVIILAQHYGSECMDALRKQLSTQFESFVVDDDEGGLSFIRIAPETLAAFLTCGLKWLNGEDATYLEKDNIIDAPVNQFLSSATSTDKGTCLLFDAGQPYKLTLGEKKARTKFGVPHPVDIKVALKLLVACSEPVVNYLSFEAECLPRKSSKDEKSFRKAIALRDQTQEFLEKVSLAIR